MNKKYAHDAFINLLQFCNIYIKIYKLLSFIYLFFTLNYSKNCKC